MPRSRIIMSLCYDHRMSKFFELALAFGMVPQIDFVPVEDYVKEDKCL